MQIDGVYSVVASGPAGSSIGVIQITNGQVIGNDNAGSRYSGTATLEADGSVTLDVAMTTPPGVFHVWSGTTGETFQTRNVKVTMTRDAFDNGKSVQMPSYSMVVIFRQVPADFAVFAGRQGIREQIRILEAAERAWANYDNS
ncbi:hypothetical protein [Mesorhizobium sp.]|uniref:hypothetical protein n=1 Tax=Mesorhizobium sp. TaxID=1871066 RepID=UPI000FE3D86D|nr:hypothetical protein [Mesorhizobium sp.]RWK29330.1 MAG: hypothetical protein EOR40_27245 [Mesorhizobium sp.]RWM08165.1 MAG: hypothetical protein EOR72_28750 [Mesorhizobium sp.]TIP06249.1 MAG: hypothetical protein E5X72_02810 [Mesorhizobium sp.]TIP20165.1 MAG: hypothetical protein E5X66_06090 [Mesorhizobium sp.]TJV84460.1 MAG: hypothetical protein E5X45_09245 [Mesorhizobium sp.]